MFESMTRKEVSILYKDIVETIRDSLDIEITKQKIVETLGKIFEADNCFIVEYEKTEGISKEITNEYKSPDSAISYLGKILDKDFPSFLELAKKGKKILINNKEIFTDEEIDFSIDRDSIERYCISSAYSFPLIYKKELLGALALQYTKTEHYITEDEIDFLSIIADQVSLAFYQSKLYNTIKKQAEKEYLLRRIFETIRSSLDVNLIKKKIVSEIGQALGADICFILSYDKEGDCFFIDEHSEYRSADDIISFVGWDTNDPALKIWIDSFRQEKEIIFLDFEDFVRKNNLEDSSEVEFARKHNLKSFYGLSIYYANNLIGFLLIDFLKDYKRLSEEDLEFVRIIAIQAGIALHQAKLYETIKLQAEREKINRNIIEILRSSIDKTIIKKLFVKNIGNFFSADRVFFSEYDSKNKIYLPVDENSEYLPLKGEKSIIGYDWSEPDVKDFIQPLLEKREFNIPSIKEYIAQNNDSQNLLRFLDDYNIKSSYNFPVLYQQNIIGFFCINFVNDIRRLSNEEINRARNMCTQAGIAFYHAELYQKAQECLLSRKSFISEVYGQIKKPAREILDTSMLLYQNEFERSREVEYLNNIITSCNKLLELTKDMNDI